MSGLIWLEDADCYGNMNWISALDATNGLQDGNCDLDDGSNAGDWRLPNIRKLYSLIDFSQDKPNNRFRSRASRTDATKLSLVARKLFN